MKIFAILEATPEADRQSVIDKFLSEYTEPDKELIAASLEEFVVSLEVYDE